MSTVPFIFAGNTGNIPLSQLDVNFANAKSAADFVIANNQANITSVGTLTGLSVNGNILGNGAVSITGNTTVGNNLSVVGTVTVAGNTIHGNISTTGLITATGNITGGNILTGGNVLSTGLVSATGNVTGGNVLTAGLVSATGNINGGNVFSAGLVSATGSIFTAGLVSATGNVTGGNINTSNLVAAKDISLSGNIIVAGNATVNGTTTTINVQTLNIADKDVVVANNVSTSVLIDGAGILAGNPTVSSLIYSHANLGWGTANNFSIGSNLTVVNLANITSANISNLSSSNVSISGGSITGITDLAVADGGTGLSSLTSNAVLIGNSTSTLKSVSPGTDANLLTASDGAWISQAPRQFDIVFQGEIAVNAISTFVLDTTRSTMLFVYFGNGQAGRGPLFSNVEWGVPSLNQQRVWYSSSEVDFQVAESGSLLATFNSGNTNLEIRVNANNAGAYGSPGTVRCLVIQF